MAYTVSTGFILEVTMRGVLFEQTCMNVWHYRVKSISATNDGVTNLDAFNAKWEEANGMLQKYLNCVSVSADTFRTRLQWVSSVRYRAKEYVPAETSGLDGVLCELPYVSASIELAGEIADRHSIGRKSIFGVATDKYQDGRPTAGYFTTLSALATKCVEELTLSTGAVMEPVIFNRDSPGASRLITQAGPKNEMRTQKSRVLGRGI